MLIWQINCVTILARVNYLVMFRGVDENATLKYCHNQRERRIYMSRFHEVINQLKEEHGLQQNELANV